MVKASSFDAGFLSMDEVSITKEGDGSRAAKMPGLAANTAAVLETRTSCPYVKKRSRLEAGGTKCRAQLAAPYKEK